MGELANPFCFLYNACTDIIRFAIIKLTSFETALIHESLYQLYDVQGIRTAWVFSKSTLLLYIEQKDT